MALAAACLFSAAPASADIELKAGCDGKWVERAGSGFDTYRVCVRETPAAPRLSALRIRAHHHRRLAHARLHRRWVAHVIPHDVTAPMVLAAATPRRDTECVNLNCPQFILVGIGW